MDAATFLATPVQRLDAGDATLAWRTFGSGPPLLLVHGYPLHGATWRRMLDELARHFTCYAFDLAGMGATTWTAATDFGFEGHARRLATWLDHMGIDACGVMAHDTGATTARCLALRVPAVVQRLVLIDTEIPGHRPPWIPTHQAATRLPGAAWLFRQLLGSRAFLRSAAGFGGCFADPAQLDGEFHEAFVVPLLTDPTRTAGALAYLRGLHWPTVDGLALRHRDIEAPVLLVWGRDDPTFPLPLARAMLPQFRPGTRLEAIAHARLFVHEERPAEVLAVVLPFLRGAGA